MTRIRVPLLALVLLLPVLVACGGSQDVDASPLGGEEALAAVQDPGNVVLDVRTPEEYAVGHLEGAENLSLESSDFDQQVADLDADASYVVYCQTGNRSARAAQEMRDAGLDVEDAGGIVDLEAAGATVVR
jgi:phage shock protein E